MGGNIVVGVSPQEMYTFLDIQDPSYGKDVVIYIQARFELSSTEEAATHMPITISIESQIKIFYDGR